MARMSRPSALPSGARWEKLPGPALLQQVLRHGQNRTPRCAVPGSLPPVVRAELPGSHGDLPERAARRLRQLHQRAQP
jgi:hypothetical protein